MIPFEETELIIVEVEGFDKSKSETILTRIYLLLENEFVEGFDPQSFVDGLNEIESEDVDPDELDYEMNQYFDEFGIIDVFTQEDIDDMVEDGEIDPEDLHQSIYDIVADNQLD